MSALPARESKGVSDVVVVVLAAEEICRCTCSIMGMTMVPMEEVSLEVSMEEVSMEAVAGNYCQLNHQ